MLKKALQLKDSKVIRCSGVSLSSHEETKLKITYHDEEGAELSETFDLSKPGGINAFNEIFAKRISKKIATALNDSEAAKETYKVETLEQALKLTTIFPKPDFVIARKQKFYWKVKNRIFDYEGNYRKAEEL
jgi:DNA repair protein RadD